MNIDIKTADGEEIELGGAYFDGRGTETGRSVSGWSTIAVSPMCPSRALPAK